jgi:tRNA(Ile)-lysidine synthase
VKWVSSADYGPRRSALTEALAALRDGKDFTLHGCRLLSSGDEVLVVREWQAVKDLEASPDKVWDNRWRLSGPENKGISI